MALDDELERLRRIRAAATEALTLADEWKKYANPDGTPKEIELTPGVEDTRVTLTQSQVNQPRNGAIRELRKVKAEAALLPDL